MVEASGLPGICKSNTGVAETDDPWTNRIVPRPPAAPGSFSRLRQRKSLTLNSPARFCVQCAVPETSARAPAGERSCARTLVAEGSVSAVTPAAAAERKLRRAGATPSPLSTLVTRSSTRNRRRDIRRWRQTGRGSAKGQRFSGSRPIELLRGEHAHDSSFAERSRGALWPLWHSFGWNRVAATTRFASLLSRYLERRVGREAWLRRFNERIHSRARTHPVGGIRKERIPVSVIAVVHRVVLRPWADHHWGGRLRVEGKVALQ